MTFVLGIMMITPVTTMAAEGDPIDFGLAESFAILAGSTITNTGTTTIEGDVGLSPGTSITGISTETVSGTIHVADAVAIDAIAALQAAYTEAEGRATTGIITENLGGTTLTPGVYTSATSIEVTGALPLILDGQWDSDAVFIFQAGSTLTTSSEIQLINGASASNVFWQVGSSATLGIGSIFVGNIMAQESITLTTGAEVEGKVMALTGAVTLDSNDIFGSIYRMSIVKTADAVEVEVGDNVNYTITVTNTGNATLSDITVTDDILGLDELIVSLGVGESSIFIDSYTTLSIGVLTNTADVTDDQAPYVVDSVDINVVAETAEPTTLTYRMSIVKTADATEVEVGDTVNYTIAVTNTGAASLNDISVTDELIGLDETITRLAVGESSIFTGSYVALSPGVLTNTASASDDQASYVADSVSTTVVADTEVPIVPVYSMSIVKTSDTAEAEIGDTINYRITVTNTGNATLNDISVLDEMIGLNTTIIS